MNNQSNNQIQNLFQNNNTSNTDNIFSSINTNNINQNQNQLQNQLQNDLQTNQKEESEGHKVMVFKRELFAELSSKNQRQKQIQQMRENLTIQNDDEYTKIPIFQNIQPNDVLQFQNDIQQIKSGLEEIKNYQFKKEDLISIEENIISANDSFTIIKSLVGLRKLIQGNYQKNKSENENEEEEEEEELDINNFNLEMAPNLIKFIGFRNFPRIQVESSCIICNLCSGNSYNQNAFINIGGLEKMMIQFKQTQELFLKINIIWALGNVCEQSKNRDYILKSQFLTTIIQDVFTYKNEYFENVGWLFQNIVSQKPYPKYSDIKYIVEHQIKQLQFLNLETQQHFIMQTLQVLKKVSIYKFINLRDQQHIIDSGLLEIFENYFSNPKAIPFYSSILNIISNLICDFEGDNFKLLANKFINQVSQLMFHEKVNIRLGALNSMVNFSGDVQIRMDIFFKNNNQQYAQIIQLLQNYPKEKSFKVQRETLGLIHNLLTQIDLDDLQFLLEKGRLLQILDLALDSIDNDTVLKSLECFLIILQKALGIEQCQNTEHDHPIIMAMENRGIVQKIIDKEHYEEQSIVEISQEILDTYFPGDEIEQDLQSEEEDN